jgi:hypothetical protein
VVRVDDRAGGNGFGPRRVGLGGGVICRAFSGLRILRLLSCLLPVVVFGADLVWGPVAEA